MGLRLKSKAKNRPLTFDDLEQGDIGRIVRRKPDEFAPCEGDIVVRVQWAGQDCVISVGKTDEGETRLWLPEAGTYRQCHLIEILEDGDLLEVTRKEV